MTPSSLTLAGFLLITRRPPGFAIPIFRHGDALYTHEVDDTDTIVAFSVFQFPSGAELLEDPDGNKIKVGDDGLYAFVFADRTVTKGNAGRVKLHLAERLFELDRHKFLRLEVLRFLNREVDIPSAIQSAFEQLSNTSPSVAEKWRQALPPSVSADKHGLGISNRTDSVGLAALGVDRYWHDEQRGASNKGVVYIDRGNVGVCTIGMPKLAIGNRKCDHGVILRIVTTNVCPVDQAFVRGPRGPSGLVMGHEITGEVIEAGAGVEFIKRGDLVSVPFNIACGSCRNCKGGQTNVCLSVNPARPGASYGYVEIAGWVGGQAEYVMVPYADFNLLKFPDKARAMDKIRDLTLLSDIFPTGYHGAVLAGVGPGSTVLIAGAGPVGLACAVSCQLRGAAVVIMADLIPERLAQAKNIGCEVVDVSKDASLSEQLCQIIGVPEVDCGIDSVGFEARGHGHSRGAKAVPATVLNSLMTITRAGGGVGIPALYATADTGDADDAANSSNLSINFGRSWAKSQVLTLGQCPAARYQRILMNAILNGRVDIAKAVNVRLLSIDDAKLAYPLSERGPAEKFVFDPRGELLAA